MVGKVRHLLERGGRYYARIVVPARIRSIVGKAELTAPLGGDRRLALRKLPAVVAGLQDRISAGEAELRRRTHAPAPARRARPLDAIEIARIQFAESVEFDTELRDTDPRYAEFGFPDEQNIASLKRIASGAAGDDETARTLAIILYRFRQRGHIQSPAGSAEWRNVCRLLAQAELASLEVSAHRDEGEPDPPLPAFLEPPAETETHSPVRVRDLFDAYLKELQRAGKARDADRKWQPVIRNLLEFLGHDDARRITKKNAVDWKDKLSEAFAPKTVRDRYIATARAAFAWGLDNERVATNPFKGVKIRYTKAKLGREKGFVDREAQAILKAANGYRKLEREQLKTAAAKRWTPLLAAYSGARIGELTQLRQEDVQEQDGIHFVRLTPDAGTIKTGSYKDVPLHPHLVELGFLDFVRASGPGPLFFRELDRTGKNAPASIVANKVAAWVRSLNVADKRVAPNHGWRHRLKTVAREIGVDPRVLDAVQGHAARTAGDDYGDVTLRAKAGVINRLPRYELSQSP
jgi:integrase